MKIEAEVDAALLADARASTGIDENDALVQAALRALLHSEASKALIALGGSDPDAWAPGRRRFD